MRAGIIIVIIGTMLLVATEKRAGERRIPESGWPEACFNRELLAAIEIISKGCQEFEPCDAATLTQLDSTIDKTLLLTALSDKTLKPIHVFFEEDVFDVEKSLHWEEWKRNHVLRLRRIDPKRSIVFVIGQASTTGDADYNFLLSQRRMESATNYLVREGVRACKWKGGWLGEDVLQLNLKDADLLEIDHDEFDRKPLQLNQAVHIFVFPCGERLGC